MEGYPFQQESHEMVFERVIAHDIDELYCPICGRRIVVQWSPDFKKTVIEPGDENAIHTASKGGQSVEDQEAQHPEELSITDQERLAEWEVLLDEIGFESWWVEGESKAG